jgi:hypothetical protein
MFLCVRIKTLQVRFSELVTDPPFPKLKQTGVVERVRSRHLGGLERE